MADLCSAADVKTYLGITDTSSDALFALLIPGVTSDLLGALDRLDLTPAADYTEFCHGPDELKLFLKHYPINSVASVKLYGQSVDEWDETPTGTGWWLPPDPNPENLQYLLLYGKTWSGRCYPYFNYGQAWDCGDFARRTHGLVPNLEIQYNGGYQNVPAWAKQAAIEFVAFRKGQGQLQAQNQGAPSETLGDYSKTAVRGEIVEYLGIEMPQSVASVIERYRRVVI